MAFSRKTFNQDIPLFENWMVLEDKSLVLALAGDEELNSGNIFLLSFSDALVKHILTLISMKG